MNGRTNMFSAITASLAEQIRQVNRKYAKAELDMSPWVKFCLLALRVYLLAMIVLMGWFLIRSLGHG